MQSKRTHECLKDALLNFVSTQSTEALDLFRDAMATWGHEWVPAPPVHLPVSDLLHLAGGGLAREVKIHLTD